MTSHDNIQIPKMLRALRTVGVAIKTAANAITAEAAPIQGVNVQLPRSKKTNAKLNRILVNIL